MSATVIALALFAAVLHAGWNAFLRTGADRLWTVTVMSFSSALIAIPMALFHALPATGAWPYVALSAGLQVGYSVFLVAAYRCGELGQVYPIVRGSVPLLVTLGGFVLAGQQLTRPEIVGVTLVACGIMGLSLGRGRASTTSILYALATGAIIAAYATVDAIGVRVAGDSGRLHRLGAADLRRLAAGDLHRPARQARRQLQRARNPQGSRRWLVRAACLCRRGRRFRTRPGRPHHRHPRNQRCLCRLHRSALPRRATDTAAHQCLRRRRAWRHLPRLSAMSGEGSRSRYSAHALRPEPDT